MADDDFVRATNGNLAYMAGALSTFLSGQLKADRNQLLPILYIVMRQNKDHANIKMSPGDQAKLSKYIENDLPALELIYEKYKDKPVLDLSEFAVRVVRPQATIEEIEAAADRERELLAAQDAALFEEEGARIAEMEAAAGNEAANKAGDHP